jgi:hypothetical protein
LLTDSIIAVSLVHLVEEDETGVIIMPNGLGDALHGVAAEVTRLDMRVTFSHRVLNIYVNATRLAAVDVFH